MSLAQFWLIVRSGKWRILACALTALAVALATAQRLPKTYEGRARILLDVSQPDPLTQRTVDPLSIESYVRTQAVIAMSDRVARVVVQKLGWETNPFVNDAWTASTGGAGNVTEWAATRIRQGLIARPLDASGTLELVYNASDPESAREITNFYREAFIEVALALEKEGSARKAEAAAKDADIAAKELMKAEAELSRLLRETGTVLRRDGNSSIENATAARERYTISARASTGRPLNPYSDKQVRSLRAKLLQLDQQIVASSVGDGVSNPRYATLVSQRSNLVRQLSFADRTVKVAESSRMAVLAADVRQAEASLNAARLQAQAGESTASLIELARSKVILYTKRFQVSSERRLVYQNQSERTESGFVVLGDVIADTEPVAPNIPRITAVALILGIVFGLLIDLILSLSRRRILSSDDLVFATGLPVLAVLPKTVTLNASRLRNLKPASSS